MPGGPSPGPLIRSPADGLVAAVIEYELTVKATGKRVHDEEIHLWEFGSDGKVTAFRHSLDTAKAIEAHRSCV